MFDALTLHGKVGELACGYQRAAALVDWRVRRRRDEESRAVTWTLTATVAERNAHWLRQRPMLFTAPRPGRMGLFCWPVRELVVGERTVRANLGPPEY